MIWFALVDNCEGSVNPSSSESAGSSPAAPIFAVISGSSSRNRDDCPAASEQVKTKPLILFLGVPNYVETPLFF